MARANRLANHRRDAACLRLSADTWNAPRSGFFASLAATPDHILIVDSYDLDALAEGGRGLAVFAGAGRSRSSGRISAKVRDASGSVASGTRVRTASNAARSAVMDASRGRADRCSGTPREPFLERAVTAAHDAGTAFVDQPFAREHRAVMRHDFREPGFASGLRAVSDDDEATLGDLEAETKSYRWTHRAGRRASPRAR